MTSLDDPDFGDGKAGKLAKGLVGTPPVRAWTVVVAANLPVPLYFGIVVTSASGRLGMACGVLLIYWLGRRACHGAGEVMAAVVRGGWVVAASQFFPVLQMAAGFAAMSLVGLSGRPRHPLSDVVGGFLEGLVTTLATGAILIAAAGGFGLLALLAVGLVKLAAR